MDNQNRVCFDSGGDCSPQRQRELVSPPAAPLRAHRGREVQVTGFAEGSRRADRVTLSVRVSSSKESVCDASSSVSRRLEYIQQTLRCTLAYFALLYFVRFGGPLNGMFSRI